MLSERSWSEKAPLRFTPFIFHSGKSKQISICQDLCSLFCVQIIVHVSFLVTLKCRLYDSMVSEYFLLIINCLTLVHTACSTLHFYQYFRRVLASAHNFLHLEFFVGWLLFSHSVIIICVVEVYYGLICVFTMTNYV